MIKNLKVTINGATMLAELNIESDTWLVKRVGDNILVYKNGDEEKIHRNEIIRLILILFDDFQDM